MFSSLGLSGVRGCGLGGGRLPAMALVPKDLSCCDEGFDDGGIAPTIPVSAEPDSRSSVWKEAISALKLFRKTLGEKEQNGD